jgi:hypothetical protein
VIVSINQPGYLPWLGYFHRIAVSDCHVVLDSVQFEKNSFTNRNRLRTQQGWTWLTVPVQTKGRFGELRIRDLPVTDDRRWAGKHASTIDLNYRRAPFHDQFVPDLTTILGREWKLLSELNRETTAYLLDQLGISTPIVSSS